jgi:hypothetical protein
MRAEEELPISAAVRLEQAQVMSESGVRREPLEQVNNERELVPAPDAEEMSPSRESQNRSRYTPVAKGVLSSFREIHYFDLHLGTHVFA